jgi:hypothetical protein
VGIFSFRTKKKQKRIESSSRTIKVPAKIYEALLLTSKKLDKTIDETVEENPLLLAQLLLIYNRGKSGSTKLN